MALRTLIQSFPEYQHLAEKATNFLDKETPVEVREPFSSVNHFDFWINNIMVKKETNGRVRNKFIDFQGFACRSPASDVFFFLWTSVNFNVLKENLDHLLQHYHLWLVNTLENLNVDTMIFGYQSFLDEIQFEAYFEFGHAILFKYLILILKPYSDEGNFESVYFTPEYKEFVEYMVSECAKRKWLN